MGMYIVRTVYNTLYTVQCSIVCLYNNTSHSKKGFCKLFTKIFAIGMTHRYTAQQALRQVKNM